MGENYKALKSIKPGATVTEAGKSSCGPNDYAPLYPLGMDKTSPGGQANAAPSMENEPRNKGGDLRNYDPPRNK